MNKCSTLLFIREMQIKTTMRYYHIPVRMAIFKSLQMKNARKGVEKREPSYTAGGNANCFHSCLLYLLQETRVNALHAIGTLI